MKFLQVCVQYSDSLQDIIHGIVNIHVYMYVFNNPTLLKIVYHGIVNISLSQFLSKTCVLQFKHLVIDINMIEFCTYYTIYYRAPRQIVANILLFPLVCKYVNLFTQGHCNLSYDSRNLFGN